MELQRYYTHSFVKLAVVQYVLRNNINTTINIILTLVQQCCCSVRFLRCKFDDPFRYIY